MVHGNARGACGSVDVDNDLPEYTWEIMEATGNQMLVQDKLMNKLVMVMFNGSSQELTMETGIMLHVDDLVMAIDI